MTTESDDIHTLTAPYALDALDVDERQVFEAHLEGCDACVREVAELQAVSAWMGASYELVPPAGLRERILQEADRTPQESGREGQAQRAGATVREGIALAPTDELGARRAQRSAAARWTGRLAVAASVVLLVAVAGLSYTVATLTGRVAELETSTTQAQTTTTRLTEVLAAPDANVVTVEGEDGAVGQVVASAARGEAVFVVDGMPAPPSDHTYQLWLIGDEGITPAGLFEPDPSGRATHVLTGDIAGASVVGVSVEPAGGSAQPTTDPVMAIEIG